MLKCVCVCVCVCMCVDMCVWTCVCAAYVYVCVVAKCAFCRHILHSLHIQQMHVCALSRVAVESTRPYSTNTHTHTHTHTHDCGGNSIRYLSTVIHVVWHDTLTTRK